MPLTRNFRETVRERALVDISFREELMMLAINFLIEGDLENGKAEIRTYIKATTTYEELAEATALSEKGLVRMFGPSGNPSTKNLTAVLRALQKMTGIKISARPSEGSDRPAN